MAMVKLTVKKPFRHEGHAVEPGDVIELTTDEARVMISRGKVAVAEDPKQQAQPRPKKGRYGRRDMVAEDISSAVLTTSDISPEPQT